jgi:MFS family permease
MAMHTTRSIWTPITIVLSLVFILCILPEPASAHDMSKSDYHNDPFTFLLFSFVMGFGTVSLVLGAFAFKFGKKRTRAFSIPMMIAGVGIWSLWTYFKVIARAEYPHDTILSVIHWAEAPLLLPLMALLGAGLGAVLALVIFLNTIVRA